VPQVRFAHDQDTVQAFAPHTSAQALTDGVRSWSTAFRAPESWFPWPSH
jgi:hypothetical protein